MLVGQRRAVSRAQSGGVCFVFDQALFDDEEVEVLSIDGGRRIAAALGNKKFCILRNHGLLTVGRSVEESVGWFVMAERVAEVHVKAPNGRPISDEAAALAASTLALTPSDGGCSSGSSARSSPIHRWSTEQLRRRQTDESMIDLT
jgi:hypothetical protein